MKYLLLLGLLAFGRLQTSHAAPIVHVALQVDPAMHSFTCRYEMALPAGDTATTLQLNLSSRFHLQSVQSPRALAQRVTRVFYPFLGDTMQQVAVRYAPQHRQARHLTLTYTGTLGKDGATDQVMVFSGHSAWLPFRPKRDYEVVDYTLEVRVPPAYQVLSTTPALKSRGGRWAFSGSTSNTEITAIIAQHFQQLRFAGEPAVTIAKAGAPLQRQDTALLRKAEAVIAFYNRSIGRQDPIKRFTIFLPGTNTDAFGLLANATVITYREFNVAEREDLMILAHEISHKWWGYGSVHNENDWLNEAFASYSSLLYLQSIGDTAGYREELAKRAETTANTPAILGFDRFKYPYPMYRRVIYNKGTVVLAALHTRVGTEPFYAMLAAMAGRKGSTTAEFLDVVEQVAGKETRAWLLGELSR